MIAIVAGTRPEFIKLGPVVAELRRREVPFRYLHTGQHPTDTHGLGGPGSSGACPDWPQPAPMPGGWVPHDPDPENAASANVARVMAAMEEHTDIVAVLVHGDTWSTYVGAKAADELGLALIHLEAGLRCWDDSVPEERIRREVDRQADLLLAASPLAAKFARVDAHADAEIVVVGQTGLDALAQVAALPRVNEFHLSPWVLLTLHRAEWPGAEDVRELVRALGRAFDGVAKVVWPVHPRWRDEAGQHENVMAMGPLLYAGMVQLLTETPPLLIVTDSGGLLEESVPLGIPCVHVRDTTERWELLDLFHVLAPPRHGTAWVVDAVMEMAAMASATRFERGPVQSPSPSPSVVAVRAIESFLASRSPP